VRWRTDAYLAWLQHLTVLLIDVILPLVGPL
jgi:hypothetical protein